MAFHEGFVELRFPNATDAQLLGIALDCRFALQEDGSNVYSLGTPLSSHHTEMNTFLSDGMRAFEIDVLAAVSEQPMIAFPTAICTLRCSLCPDSIPDHYKNMAREILKQAWENVPVTWTTPLSREIDQKWANFIVQTCATPERAAPFYIFVRSCFHLLDDADDPLDAVEESFSVARKMHCDEHTALLLRQCLMELARGRGYNFQTRKWIYSEVLREYPEIGAKAVAWPDGSRGFVTLDDN